MIKYSFEQKKALVTAYLNGEGGIRTVLKSMVIQIVLNFKDGLLHIKCMEMMD